MSRPVDMPTAERWPHGVRARYACGCYLKPALQIGKQGRVLAKTELRIKRFYRSVMT